MRVLLSTYGSRGDVEPVAALGAALQALGAEAVVCAPPDEEFRHLLARAGVPLSSAFSSVREWVTAALRNKDVDVRKRAAEIVRLQYDAINAAADGCDVVVATGLFPSTAAARAVAEKRDLTYVYGAYCPFFLPSEHHAPHTHPGHENAEGVTDNKVLWAENIASMNAMFGEGINAARTSVGLAPVDNVRDHVFTDRPWLATDATLSPWLPTELREVVQTGQWMLPDDRPLSPELTAFLNEGAPPVYVGFGSMPMQAAKDAGLAAIEAARAHGKRVLFSQGWADLDLGDNRDDCFAVGDVNQQKLFPQVAAVVHHGGAGTTHTAARSGAPQVVVPQIADQFYWAGRVAELGIGVAHSGPPTFESLSTALRTALSSGGRARGVSTSIRSDGATVAAKRLLAMA
jgi:vancomycin aglycone glucosyltransferase